jgi:hypothetical protein
VPTGIVEYDAKGEDKQNVIKFNPDMNLEITPSISRIMREMRGDWVWADPEFEIDPKTGNKKQLASSGHLKSIGELHFSNGEQKEKAFCYGPGGDVIEYNRTVERGGMLRTTEETGAAKGSAEQSSRVEISNQNLTTVLLGRDDKGELVTPAPAVRKYIPSGTMRKGTSLTADQSRAMIADAIANTKVMPSVTYLPKGLPMGTAKASNCFIGMKPKPSGKGGASIRWVDFFMAGQDRKEWLAVIGELDETTHKVIETALEAGSYAEVGVAMGQSKSYARTKGGKMLLKAANDNLAEIIRKSAA